MRKPVSTGLTAFTVVMVGVWAGTGAQVSTQTSSSLTVVYNHEGATSGTELLKRGGLAVHVQLEDRSLLFDTGGEAGVILDNLRSLGLHDAELEAVVISHNHWDHVYGLPGVMRSARNSPPVYVTASATVGLKQQFPRATVIGVEKPTQISPGIWLTGPLEIDFMGAPLSEQALVLERPDGLHIITGCSHPGIVTIVEQAKKMFPQTPIAMVAGGFHLRSTSEQEIRRIASDLERLGVRKIAPSHCTGESAVRILRERWGERFVRLGLGDSYDF